MQQVEPFKVKVANDNAIPCQTIYQVVPIKIQGIKIAADLYVLPLVGPNLVLGVIGTIRPYTY